MTIKPISLAGQQAKSSLLYRYKNLKAGESFVYYTGFIAPLTNVDTDAGHEALYLGSTAFEIYAEQGAFLTQRRVEPYKFDYIITKPLADAL